MASADFPVVMVTLFRVRWLHPTVKDLPVKRKDRLDMPTTSTRPVTVQARVSHMSLVGPALCHRLQIPVRGRPLGVRLAFP